MSTHKGWIGVDLDGTLARYDGWKGTQHIGDPVPEMLARVKKWLEEGKDVRIFTARVCFSKQANAWESMQAVDAIHNWCLLHIGQTLPVTCVKDFAMIELWDDRAVQVIPNTGRRVDGNP